MTESKIDKYVLLGGGTVITMNPTRDVVSDGSVLIHNDLIEKVGKKEDIDKYLMEEKIRPEIIDTSTSVVMPGLVCNHTHLFQCIYRGLGENFMVNNWVAKLIFPMSLQMGEEEAYYSGMLSQMEMIRTGTTCFADSHYVHKSKRCMDGLAKSVEDTGMRGMLVRATQNVRSFEIFPTDFLEDYDTIESESIRCIETYHNTLNKRLRVSLESLTEIDCDEKALHLLYDIAKQYKTGFHMHAAEAMDEIISISADKGMRVIEYLDKLKLLGENTLLAHCIWITPHEQRLLAESGTKVAHNPVSNMMLGDGVAPILELREMGVDIGIGVDGGASNNSQDMFEAMKTCLLQHRARWLDAGVLKPEDVFEMATIIAAKTLRWEDEIGSLEVGKKADVTICNRNQIQFTPDVKPISSIVLSANGSNVDTVIVDGEILLRDKKFTKLDEEALLMEINKVAKRMIEKAGIGYLQTDGRYNYI